MKLVLILLFITLPCFAAGKNSDISFSGWGEAGIKNEKQNMVNGPPVITYYAAKLQSDIKINQKIDVKIDVKGNSADNQVDFNGFSIKFDYHDYFKIKIGNLKQPFGHEQQTSRTNLLTFNRSNAHFALAKMGYANRSLAVKGYYNYSKKRPNFPYSYAINIYRNNSTQSGINLKGSKHFNDLIVSSYFQYLKKINRTGVKINTVAVGSDVIYQTKSSTMSMGLFILEDPVVGVQNVEQNILIKSDSLDQSLLDESIIAGTLQSFVAHRFNINGEVIHSIEPLLLTSLYVPFLQESESYEWQTVFGFNAYLNKDVRLRLQVDYIFTNKESTEQSSIYGSSIELGVQVSF
ncbi:MAG: hypothetical protein HRU38_18510 [Saccharospirillaceae bacterium]|nr:porin [Pseudomonadales bacterium]NRB80630.1 hypothetical protein [Saccharospirillaceae bacterium]